ncbi:uncharacterized protein LOC129247286 [Anastrepha obliqua]|uniref:uncharacterized protein LOC129247286 n=1 Tax=Anastrepha obliqua TaxID=95512 RepID=UPI0024094A30|nr:uncharacterized protein LOC129247286 [Anastrepha obliqua]
MVSIDDEDDHNHHNAETERTSGKTTLQTLKTSSGDYRRCTATYSDNKRNTTYSHFLRKTRRKSSNRSFKASTPTSNIRKCQALSAYWHNILTSRSKSFIGNTRVGSFHITQSLESLAATESDVKRKASNTCTNNNPLSFEGARNCHECPEMKLEWNVKRSKSETSLSNNCSEGAFKHTPSCCSSESESALKECKLRASEVEVNLKHFKSSVSSNKANCDSASGSSSRSGHNRHTKCAWTDRSKSYVTGSNNRETNGSYRRRPQTIERLCKRKKRRLRRRRKRKEYTSQQSEEEKNPKYTIATTSEQVATTYTTILSPVVAFNVHETHKSAIDSHAQPVTATTAATTHHDTLGGVSTIAELSSTSNTTEMHKDTLPATATLPKFTDCHKHSNKSCCSGNSTGVQQHSRSSNKMATINTCSAAVAATSSLSSAACDAASPAICLSAFYATTTLRLFLTTLTTLIASTTPTTFTATKYSWIFLWIYVNLTARVGLAGYHEKRLLHDLLDPYNTLERPVLNESDPLQLSFGLTLMQIIDVDEKNQLLVTNVWLKLEWNDMNLRWNTSDYGGVKDLRIPPHRIWKPDVLMYNSADEGFDGTYQTNVVVRNNGSCLYVPPGIFKSTCKIDITWFPFDDQRCEMKFGSWTYDGFQLDLQLQDETGGDISSYVLNGEWELLGVPGKRNEIYYNCCPEPYIDITFAIIIRRRTLYYFFNLIIPCVLIASMALLGFTLPPDSGEKLSLGVTILLSLTVFLNMVAETMPATSDAVPLLGTYFNCIMFMVASSVVSTILILNYHHRNADTHEMSEWIRIVFLCWLPWILRMSRPGRPLILEFPTTPCSDTSSERKHQILSDVELKERSSKSLLANVLDIDDDFRHNCRPMTPGGTLPHNPAFYRTVYGQGDDGSIGPIGSTRMPDAVTHHTCIKSATEYELGLILKEIRFITDQLRKEDEENDIANDWKFAAMVVDRLCLIIFTMFTILATIAVLLSAPHIIVS